MKRFVVGSGLIAALAAGALLSPIGAAIAGHTNTVLTAKLDGRSEVVTGATDSSIVGDPNGRGEAYVFGIDGDPKTLCYVLTVDKIEPATAAHIHLGAAGSNGPVVVNLARPTDGNAADCLTEGEKNPMTGALAFPGTNPVTVAQVLASPGDFYVNVHNTEFPGGAIRGQLAPER